MDALPIKLEKWGLLKSLLVGNHKPTGQELIAPGMPQLENTLCGMMDPIPASFFLLFILILNYLSALKLEDLPSWDAAVLHQSGLLGKSLRGDRNRMGSAGGASMLRKHFALDCLLLK